MLRHRHDEPTARPQRPVELTQHKLILVNVLDDVECADHVEVLGERHLAGIDLEEWRRRNALLRNLKSARKNLAPHQREVWAGHAESVEHIASPAADLEETLCVW